jgi:ArsR family transcriptional regulator
MKKAPHQLFKALSDESRLRIVKLLSGGELCVCDLTQALEMGQSKVSRHLAYLKESGLIVGRDEGKWSYYALAKPRNLLQRELLAMVDELADDSSFKRDVSRLTRRPGRCD